MKLLCGRWKFGDDSTLSRMYEVDDEGGLEFECFVLEDELRKIKVPGETAISAGVYVIESRDEGTMTRKYRNRYGELHVGMAHLQNVPNFKYVYIHTGNTDDHTEGCLLVGTGYKPTGVGRNNHVVTGSRSAYVPLYKRMAAAWVRGEQVIITITDEEVKVG